MKCTSTKGEGGSTTIERPANPFMIWEFDPIIGRHCQSTTTSAKIQVMAAVSTKSEDHHFCQIINYEEKFMTTIQTNSCAITN